MDAEERLAETKTLAERSELLVTILTDVVARGVHQENPSSKRARSSNTKKRETKKQREKSKEV
jgi:hypothetical protein